MQLQDRLFLFFVQASTTAMAVDACLKGWYSNYWEALLVSALGMVFSLAILWFTCMTALFVRDIARLSVLTLRIFLRLLIDRLRAHHAQ